MPGPEADLKLLTSALRDAGALVLRYWRKQPKSWEKEDDAGPVSEADLASNTLLEAQLRTARTDYGWLSEETADSQDRLTRQRCFIIDPIDGTRSFLQGEDTFAVVAGICDAGRMIASAVYLPALDRMYEAALNGPALLNGAPIRVSQTTEPKGATMLTAAGNLTPAHWPGGVPDVRRAFRPSLAYRLCLVAEGRHDSMASLRPTWEWDIAAASLILERAGGRITDGQGQELRFNSPEPKHQHGILAAPPDLHKALLKLRHPKAS